MKYYSLRVIHAKSGAEATQKCKNGDFYDFDELSDVIINEKRLPLRLGLRKLVSLNPDRKQLIEMKKLIGGYGYYCYCFGQSRANIGIGKLRRLKTFEEWLNTEI